MRLHLSRARRLPRIALLLALVLLIPVTGLAALTGSSAISTWRERQAAIKVRTQIAAPSALMAARALVVNEGVASIAVANARENGLGIARLKQLSGVDFEAMLRTTRPRVDASAALHTYPSLRADLQILAKLRAQLDAGTAGTQAFWGSTPGSPPTSTPSGSRSCMICAGQ